MILKLILSALVTIVFVTNAALAFADEIRIGALHDLSGATADAGRDYALGIAEAVGYVNDNGGVNGRPIKLYQYDYGYRIAEVQAKYKQLKRFGVAAILGWHLVDTKALSAWVAEDEIPYLAAFSPADLTLPRRSPYNLYVGTDDSSKARAVLTAWFDEKWPQKDDYGTRRPRVQFAYMVSSANLSAPIKAIKDQAELFGFQVGPDQDISIFAADVRSQVEAMKRFKPDFIYHGNTALSVAATIREAAASGLATDHVVNSWAFDENLIRLAGAAVNGVMGAGSCAFYGQDEPLMDTIRIYGKKLNPGVPAEKRLVHTTQAWATVLALREALKRADTAGDLSGQTIMEMGFETFDGVDIGLGVSPLTYTSSDHRASGKVNIYQIKNQEFVFMTQIDLKGRWPDKWANAWFGW